MINKANELLDHLEIYVSKNITRCHVEKDRDGTLKIKVLIPDAQGKININSAIEIINYDSSQVIHIRIYHTTWANRIFRDRLALYDTGTTGFFVLKNRILKLRQFIVDSLLEYNQSNSCTDGFETAANNAIASLIRSASPIQNLTKYP